MRRSEEPYESTGRTAQKLRTRNALVEAARALIITGITPTVEEAADEASISRTTAYRYFPNQHDLLVAAYPMIELGALIDNYPPEAVEARLDAVLEAYLQSTVANDAALRAALRLSLDPQWEDQKQLILRQGRVITWLKDALEPLNAQLSEKVVERLVFAIRSAAGIEALVWLCDVAGLSRDEAKDLMKWSARALFQTALAEAKLKIRDIEVDKLSDVPKRKL